MTKTKFVGITMGGYGFVSIDEDGNVYKLEGRQWSLIAGPKYAAIANDEVQP